MAIDISNRPDRPVRKFTIPDKHVQGLSSDILKLIAIVAMLIDHVAWAFVDFHSLLGQAMHIIGRLTAPIMCFMLAEGYYRTCNVKKYAIRLGVFALISHFPYAYFFTGEFQFLHQTSVIFTLFLGLIALIVSNSPKYNQNVKTVILLVIFILSMFADWGGLGIVWILIFSSNRYSRSLQMKYFSISTAIMIGLNIFLNMSNGYWYNNLFQLGIFLAVPLLSQYNGVRKSGKGCKWFFYIFYPAHLLLIGILKFSVLK